VPADHSQVVELVSWVKTVAREVARHLEEQNKAFEKTLGQKKVLEASLRTPKKQPPVVNRPNWGSIRRDWSCSRREMTPRKRGKKARGGSKACLKTWRRPAKSEQGSTRPMPDYTRHWRMSRTKQRHCRVRWMRVP